MIPMPESLQLNEDHLIMTMPDSEYGRAFLSRVKSWLSERDEDYFLTLRISNEDIRMDFRYKAGFIAALKQVLNEPTRIREQISNI
jgi:hypothetical protein